MVDMQPSSLAQPAGPAEKILQYLLQKPCDLIDTKRLMRRFRTSAADVERALSQFEILSGEEEKPSAC